MSQRLIQPGLSAAEQFRLRNKPHIIGYTKRGPVWSVAGGADDGGAPEDGDPPDPGDGGGGKVKTGGDGGTDDDPPDDDDDANKPGDKNKNKPDKDDDDDEVEYLKSQVDKYKSRMTAADRRASDLQRQLDEVKAGKDVSEDVKRELSTLKVENERLVKANHDQAIRLAFFTVNSVEWEDVDTALKLLDLSDVDVDDNGHVDKRALRAAVRDLAKTKPYLVKRKDNNGGDGGNNSGGNGGTAPPMGRRTGQSGSSDQESLKRRFPVLNRP